ncbi:hypothetical protein CYMTET_28841 [Cymbomonas tetramitiformis]|uniref:Proteasome assembly chaperone 1 n=1 Tax=Cymbomonas tetramitiformis TaxID=36881 RepID=A0AAE0KVH8_9CHLO|nr:hypothetical protein CYMTET_28841 [Cymbomonas tetramitiformis]
MSDLDCVTLPPPPSRIHSDDEERDMELFAMAPQAPVIVNLTSEAKSKLKDGKLCPSSLVIATSPAGCMILCHLISSKTVIGSLTLPECSMANNTLSSSHTNKDCFIYQTSFDTILVACQYDVQPGRCGALVKALFSVMDPTSVTIVNSVSSCDLCTLPPDEGIVALETDLYKERRRVPSDIMYLPSGNMVDGLPAALMSHCQTRGVAAQLLVSIEHAPVPDETTLLQLAQVLDHEVSAIGDTLGLELDNFGCATGDVQHSYSHSSHSTLFT